MIIEKTGMVPDIYDKGTHYVTNHRLTLEMLKEISDLEYVVEVTGEYTDGITGRGASRLRRNHAFDIFSQSFLEAHNTMDIEGIQVR